MSIFHDLEMLSITGEPVSLSDYAGRVCLVVNVASA
jgi:glutathione peroxidase-family protein